MKKNNSPKAPLKLATETVIKLTADLLPQVAGGMIKITKHSACDSACSNC